MRSNFLLALNLQQSIHTQKILNNSLLMNEFTIADSGLLLKLITNDHELKIRNVKPSVLNTGLFHLCGLLKYVALIILLYTW